jgi:hypothetical protein
MDDKRNCHAGQRSVAARHIVWDAQRNYADAIRVLRGQRYASDELYELEDKLLRSSYLLGDSKTARQSLVRLILDDAANSEPMSRVDRLIQLADLDFRNRHTQTQALDLYLETYAYLEKQGVARARIDEIFSPATPIALPTFLPNLFAPERAQGATGYVDVEFDITRFGTTRRIRILDTSGNVSNAAQGRVTRWIVENHFRPRVIDGQFANASRVVARHYVHE